MAKHANEIALEQKAKKMAEESKNSQCLFTQVDSINAFIQDLSDRLDQFPTASDIFLWNKKLGDTREILELNFKRCNEMINELKGIVAMARASLAERKECDSNKCKTKIALFERKEDNKDILIQSLTHENELLKNTLDDLMSLMNKKSLKKWWMFWK